jgi:hypothetical protein
VRRHLGRLDRDQPRPIECTALPRYSQRKKGLLQICFVRYKRPQGEQAATYREVYPRKRKVASFGAAAYRIWSKQRTGSRSRFVQGPHEQICQGIVLGHKQANAFHLGGESEIGRTESEGMHKNSDEAREDTMDYGF